MLRIGVIGVGVMGAAHVGYLTHQVPGAVVRAVFDVDAERAAQAASVAAAEVAGTATEVMSSDDIDALVVAAPDGAHVELAIAAIAAGIPTLIEKPLAATLDGAASVVEAEVAFGRRLLSLGFMRRFDPQHLAVADAVSGGKVGRARLFRGIHRNPEPPPGFTTRLTVTGSAIHDIDSVRWFLGDFRSVHAVGSSLDSAGALDIVHIQGEHHNGGISAIEVSISAGYGYEVQVEIVGATATVATSSPALATASIEGRRSSAVPQSWLERFGAAYVAELGEWVQATVAGTALGSAGYGGASAWDGYAAQMVAEAVMSSLDAGRRIEVVSSEVPDLYR